MFGNVSKAMDEIIIAFSVIGLPVSFVAIFVSFFYKPLPTWLCIVSFLFYSYWYKQSGGGGE